MKTKSKHAPKRTTHQIEQDRADIARLCLERRQQREIVAWIAANRPYTLSLGSINRSVKQSEALWRREATGSIENWKARDLARLDEIERRAWEGFERSRLPRVIKRTCGGKTVTTTEQRDGDPRWLEIIRQCIARRADILGYASNSLQVGVALECHGTNGELVPDVRLALEVVYGRALPETKSFGG
jgi:hypothetical protein